ncbi:MULTISPECIES: multicopper oxidase domain-containing protein [unclassified Bradyrhizobium]|uniref:multicopper oxidase family protein n=1 Tax=unclassified Bradyrhizobium TaxID=2631580 RepID=UPI002010CEB9|nr:MULTISPECIES: multicopper oxidase domain-containing protein [unclassified Bradyrhizobium]
MTSRFTPSRRAVLAGFAGTALTSLGASPALAQARPQGRQLALRLQTTAQPLRDNQPPSAVWAFADGSAPLTLPQGDVEITLTNDLPLPIVPDIHGLAGSATSEPLLARQPIAPGQSARLAFTVRQSGTLLLDTRLLGDGAARALPVRPLVAPEAARLSADRDETLLIEDWRFGPDGTALAPGRDPAGASPLFTINGKSAFDLTVRRHERVRLRLINGCQRAVIAFKIDDHDLQVMAIDSHPAEPFAARNGQVVLAPGSRVDTFVDMTAEPSRPAAIRLHDGTTARQVGRLLYGEATPLRLAPLASLETFPSNGLPDKLDLQNALRVDLPLDIKPAPGGWSPPITFTAGQPPSFRAKRGRVVVLALTNRAATPVMFRLHGGPFRLLDRLDDGWKPFWLDTLLLDARQTHRIAFPATAGSWLLESAGTDWATPRLVQWYAVE